MAEALAVIGTIGAVCNIVDVISKTIAVISEYQSRWKTADLALLSLASQLTALRAALTEIQKWLERNTQDMHHQLTMDLEVSLSCCRLLASELEAFFSQFSINDDHVLSSSDKIKFVLRSQGAKDTRKFIEHQTSSLTLLLTACNCTTLADQKALLERPKTRKTLARPQSDSVSLLVLRDSASFVSKWTDNLSKLSYTFDFDTELLSSWVYGRMFRESLKQSIRKRSIATSSAPVQHILLLGHNDMPKIEVESCILSQHQAQLSSEAKLLAKAGARLRVSCTRLTLGVVRDLYGDEKSFRPRFIESMMMMDQESRQSTDLYLLHAITTFWQHPAFSSSMYEGRNIFLANAEVRKAYEYIISRLKQKNNQIPPPFFDGTNCMSSVPTLDQISYSDFHLNELPVALHTVWDVDVSIIPSLNGCPAPLAILSVFDMEAPGMHGRLENTVKLFETLKSPQHIPLAMILTSSHAPSDPQDLSEPERRTRVLEVLERFRCATVLPLESFEYWGGNSFELGCFASDMMRQAAENTVAVEGTLTWPQEKVDLDAAVIEARHRAHHCARGRGQ